jgi:hypothetical protein
MSLYADSAAAQVALTVAFSLIVLTDIIGNTMVVLVLLTNKSTRTPMNFLLVNLAIADMMVAIFIAPRFIFMNSFVHPDGITGTWVCKLFTGGNISWTAGACSVFTLVAIAFERYFAVMFPHSEKGKMTIRKLKIIIFSCWIGAIILNIPLYATIYYEKTNNFCFEYWPDAWLPVAYASTWWAAAGAFPICTMTVLYSRVIYRLWGQNGDRSNTSQQAVLKYRKKVTKMMLTVSFVYVICWVPILTTYMLSYTHPNFNYGDVIHISSMVLSNLNSTVNPFIYVFQNERFRKLLRQTCCRSRSNKVDIGSSGASNNRKRSQVNTNEGFIGNAAHEEFQEHQGPMERDLGQESGIEGTYKPC